MKMFSPTAFGSLYLAFKLEKSHEIGSDFVDSLLNSPGEGRFQRLHFYVHPKSKFNDSFIEKIFKTIGRDSKSIKGRPWCENLLPFIEFPDEEHPMDIVHSNSEMIFIIDRFPKVRGLSLKKDKVYELFTGKLALFVCSKEEN